MLCNKLCQLYASWQSMGVDKMKTKAEEVLALEDEEFARLGDDFYSKPARAKLLDQDALNHEEDCFMSGYEEYETEEEIEDELLALNEDQPGKIA